MIEANGVELCTEAFGDRADPPILLIMGSGASMLWWEEDLCRALAGGGRFVIRYDHRDTGRSATCPPGRPTYSGTDLSADAAAVLDAYGLAAAHLVGASAGAGCAQVLALEHPGRVLSLVLISTTPATAGDRGLPPPNEAFGRFVASATVDWADSDSVIEYLTAYQRLLAGEARRFDAAATRELVRADVARTRNPAALQNHDLALAETEPPREPLSAIVAPTLVIHGSADPMFPIEHGRALAAEIPGARLLALDGAGHGLFRPDWDAITTAVLEHTAPEAPAGIEPA